MPAHLPGARDELTERALGRADATVPGHSGQSALATTVTSTLITGPAVLGAIGWLLDRWLGTTTLTPIGILAGLALAMYVVWLRYGTAVTDEPAQTSTTLNDEENQ